MLWTSQMIKAGGFRVPVFPAPLSLVRHWDSFLNSWASSRVLVHSLSAEVSLPFQQDL